MESRPFTENDAGRPISSYLRMPSIRKIKVTTVITLLAVITIGGIALSGSAVAATDSPEFENAIVTLTESGETTIEVDSGTAKRVELVIGGQEVGYELTAAVKTNEDGTATLRLNHSATATDTHTLTAEGDANVEIDAETELPEPIEPGNYDMDLFVPNETESAGVGVLVVEDGSSDTGDETGENETNTDRAERQPIEKEVAEDADLIVENRDDQWIVVPVEADDGVEVPIRIESANADSAFLLTRDASVEDGDAAATFDFSAVKHGTAATANGRYDGSTVGSVEVLVVDPTIGVEGVEDLDELDTGGESESRDKSEVENTRNETDIEDEEIDGRLNDQPGFGPALAVLALCAAALLANRS